MKHRRFTTIQKSCGWELGYKKATEMFGRDRADELFDKAAELNKSFQSRYSREKGIRKGHMMGAAAISALYIPLSELATKDDAVNFITKIMKPASIVKHNKIEKLPAPVYMKVAGFITGKMFSEKAGFKRNWHCNTNYEKRYDLLTCPYVQVFSELGCPEVCPAVCIQDDISFGNMKNGVIFERKGTLGRGDGCCDFCFRISERSERGTDADNG